MTLRDEVERAERLKCDAERQKEEAQRSDAFARQRQDDALYDQVRGVSVYVNRLFGEAQDILWPGKEWSIERSEGWITRVRKNVDEWAYDEYGVFHSTLPACGYVPVHVWEMVAADSPKRDYDRCSWAFLAGWLFYYDEPVRLSILYNLENALYSVAFEDLGRRHFRKRFRETRYELQSDKATRRCCYWYHTWVAQDQLKQELAKHIAGELELRRSR